MCYRLSRRSFVILAGLAACAAAIPAWADEPLAETQPGEDELALWEGGGVSVRYPISWDVVEQEPKAPESSNTDNPPSANTDADSSDAEPETYEFEARLGENSAFTLQVGDMGLPMASEGMVEFLLMAMISSMMEEDGLEMSFGSYKAQEIEPGVFAATAPIEITAGDMLGTGAIHVAMFGSTMAIALYILGPGHTGEQEQQVVAALESLEYDTNAAPARKTFDGSDLEERGEGTAWIEDVQLEAPVEPGTGALHGTWLNLKGFPAGAWEAYIDGTLVHEGAYSEGVSMTQSMVLLGEDQLTEGAHVLEVVMWDGEDAVLYKRSEYSVTVVAN